MIGKKILNKILEGVEQPLLNPREVADLLGVSRSYVYNFLQKDPDFPAAITIMGKKYWNSEGIEQYKERKKQEILKQIAQLDTPK